MNPSEASSETKLKVGLFSLFALVLIGAVTVYVNDKPFWWRPCKLEKINLEDATGLKTKSPIRSLGIQIGYISSIELYETHVSLGVCITAPVEILPETKAYLRGEGFLGDKFVELKPVKYIGAKTSSVSDLLISNAYAEDEGSTQNPSTSQPELNPKTQPRGKEIPVGKGGEDISHLVKQVDGLVTEMTALTSNLKEAMDPKELKKTLQQLNKTLENASRTLSPEGGLTTTAQRVLAKLEDAIEQVRDQLTRVNRGQGSLGMLLNDPYYAEQIGKALENVNKLLNKVQDFQFIVDIGIEKLPAYDGTRGFFKLAIWPKIDRYYLLGLTTDPRGKKTTTTTTTESGGQTTTVKTTQVEESGLLFTLMLGKVFYNRFDGAIGLNHGDGTLSAGIYLGPGLWREAAIFRNDLYSRGKGYGLDVRSTLTVRPFIGSPLLSSLYIRGGAEGFRKVDGRANWQYGAGIAFSDEDIKLLFAFK